MELNLNPKEVKEEVIEAGIVENLHVVTQKDIKYTVCIKANPCCSCPDFQDQVDSKRSFLACKHMYHVYLSVIGLSMHENMFIHQPYLTKNDLIFALTKPRAYLL